MFWLYHWLTCYCSTVLMTPFGLLRPPVASLSNTVWNFPITLLKRGDHRKKKKKILYSLPVSTPAALPYPSRTAHTYKLPVPRDQERCSTVRALTSQSVDRIFWHYLLALPIQLKRSYCTMWSFYQWFNIGIPVEVAVQFNDLKVL